MKLIVYNDDSKETVRLRLVQKSFGVALIVVDEEGREVDCGTILYIHNSDGCIHMAGGFNSKMGLTLSDNRTVTVKG